jgi:hypothetical protein
MSDTTRLIHHLEVETLMPILLDTQPAPTQPPQPAAAAVIDERRYLQRFNRSQVRLLVLQTCRTASNDLVTRIRFEPWLGL